MALLVGVTTAHAQQEPDDEMGPAIHGTVTFYGISYHGNRMACGGTYSTYDPTILAVGPARYGQWPCGQELEISGPAGTIRVRRTDSCGGCGPNLLDLSEAGNAAVCGSPPHTCRVTIREVR